MSGKKIRVLVVDDSALMRKRLGEMINSDDTCEVVAAARNGEEALSLVAALRPDVVTLDIELPRMDGITVLQYIMSEWPTPVVIVSAYSKYRGQETIRCLEYGAVDLVAKPGGAISLDVERVKEELLSKVRSAARVNRRVLRIVDSPAPAKPDAGFNRGKNPFSPRYPSSKINWKKEGKVVAIASSTGGPKALMEVLPQINHGFSGGLIVIQHMPAGFTQSMAERLNESSKIPVQEAEDGESLRQGAAFIVPGGFHLTLQSDGERGPVMKLSPGKKGHSICPSADLTMGSLAALYGKRCMGVVLTGMGNDGTEGLRSVKEAGGYTVAESSSTCIVYGMPRAAVQAGVIDKVLPLRDIAAEIGKWAGK